MTEIRSKNPLPELAGAVDAYPHDDAVALAYGLDLRPRPVFQSYMAYTPRLARANADFLLSADAPEWILFRISTINGRLPALDDATSWPRLMTRYRVTAEAGAYAVLQRRQRPLSWHLEQLAHVDTTTGSTVAVPPASDGPIWARIDVETTRRDALVGALLVPPVIGVGVALSDGKQFTHRLVPALAREGFLLSPLVENTADFIRLMTMDPELFNRSSVTAFAVQMCRDSHRRRAASDARRVSPPRRRPITRCGTVRPAAREGGAMAQYRRNLPQLTGGLFLTDGGIETTLIFH
jgi:hypothetical protein